MALHPKAQQTLDRWHRMVAAGNLAEVAALLTPDAVFRSPVAFTPYHGATLVAHFLQQALHAFEAFQYHRTFYAGDDNVVLEFSARVGDKALKGIDMIRFDADGRMAEFEVMVRPASGVQALGAEMACRMTPILAGHKT